MIRTISRTLKNEPRPAPAPRPLAPWLLALALGLTLTSTACQKKAATDDPAPEAAEAQPAGDGAEREEPENLELEYWKSVRDSEHTDDLWKYLERYPNGAFADLAKSRIERLASGAGGDAGGTADTQAQAPAPPAAAPQTTAPQAPQAKTGGSSGSNIRQSRRSTVTRVVRRELKGFSDSRLHIAPDIPRFKLDNAAQVHGFDPQRAILLWDDGFRGGGKTGMVLTDRRLYWRFVAGSDAYFLDYEDIQSVRIRKNQFRVNGYEIGTSMADNSRVAAERLGELIEALRDAFR